MHGGDDKLGERKEKHTDLANMYYDLVTDFYEYGWGGSFHFAPRHKYEVDFLILILFFVFVFVFVCVGCIFMIFCDSQR